MSAEKRTGLELRLELEPQADLDLPLDRRRPPKEVELMGCDRGEGHEERIRESRDRPAPVRVVEQVGDLDSQLRTQLADREGSEDPEVHVPDGRSAELVAAAGPEPVDPSAVGCEKSDLSYQGSLFEPGVPVGLGSPCTLIRMKVPEPQPWQLSAGLEPPTVKGVPE